MVTSYTCHDSHYTDIFASPTNIYRCVLRSTGIEYYIVGNIWGGGYKG